MRRKLIYATVTAAVLSLFASVSQAQLRSYRGTYQSVRNTIVRIDNRTGPFSNSLQTELNRRGTAINRSEDIFQFANDFAESVHTLRDRFERRQSTRADAQDVLNRATRIDDFMRRFATGSESQSQWSSMRVDLNQLAYAYSITWRQSTGNYPPYNNPPDGNRFGDRLTGTYSLDASRSDNPRDAADRAARNLPWNQRQQVQDTLSRRLEAPDQIAIDVRGRTVTIASSKAAQITFEADGVDRTETNANGHLVHARASLIGQQLTVSSTGDRGNDFSVTFDPIVNGQGLNVTRQVYVQGLSAPITVRSSYTKTDQVARFDIFNNQNYPGQPGPTGGFVVPDGTIVVATLDSQLSTRTAVVGDRFTLRVNQPVEFEGATVEGHISSVQRSGRLTGRSIMTLDFDNIRLRDGRSYRFAGLVQEVRTASGEIVRVDTEGAVRDTNQTTKTEQRAAIGTAVGAIIGAIAGGGKGAAIGAIVGAGAGAGSVYAQGRDDLDLGRGTELTIRAGAPAYATPR
jgi:hypothetical protein